MLFSHYVPLINGLAVVLTGCTTYKLHEIHLEDGDENHVPMGDVGLFSGLQFS